MDWDWAKILGSIIPALVVAIGIPLALKKRKKASPGKVAEILQHLQAAGLRASLLDKGTPQEMVGTGRFSGQKVEGAIKIEGRKIDGVNVASTSSQYGVEFSLDYLVKSPGLALKRKIKKTRMTKKKSSGWRGRTVDIEWKGDEELARELNCDSRLKDWLIQAELSRSKGNITIIPEPEHEYFRIRTPYLLPSPDLLEAIDLIAGHIKSGW